MRLSKSMFSLLLWACEREVVGFKKIANQVNFKNMMELSLLCPAHLAEKVVLTILAAGAF